MGRLGNRIVMGDVGSEIVTTDELVASMRGEVSYKGRVLLCGEAVGEFLVALWEESGGYGSIEWDASADDANLQKVLVMVAEWVVNCRGAVSLESDYVYGEEHSTVMTEAVHRLLATLYSLAKGHAIACDRRSLAIGDVQLVVRIALDSMQRDRRHVVRALLRSGGVLNSAQVEKVLDQSRPTARKVMEALGALKAVETETEGTSLTISLREAQLWLLDDAHQWVLARIPSEKNLTLCEQNN